MGRDAGNLDLARRQVYHHQYRVRHQAMPGGHLDREEIGRGQDLPVQLQELRPAHPSPAALRRWFKRMATQDSAHSQLVNAMSKVRYGTLDASIPPGGILFGHADDQLLDFLCDTRSANLSVMRAPVKLLRDQSLVPPQEGLRGHKCRNLFQTRATERVSQRGEAAAVGIGRAGA